MFGIFKKNTKTVLIVEDDMRLRASLREGFVMKGFEVLEAGDAKSVLDMLAKNVPQAMVLDLILPVKDGVSLLEDIREAGFTFPVIILSNLLGSSDLRADAERLDAVFYNKSATTLDEIVSAVVTHIA
jgi:DNA-binding response OmpR family regulator